MIRFTLLNRIQHLTFVAVLAGLCLRSAIADPINVSIDTSKLGVTPNEDCGIKGICGAIASINSFAYLSRQFPTVYGNLPNGLLPNFNTTTNTDSVDAKKFAVDGWQVGMNPARIGYYNRTGGAELDYLQTKMDWFNDYAPGTTMFDSWWATPAGKPEWASPHNTAKPTVANLVGALQQNKDVEFFVQRENFYHVMTLTGIECDMAMNCAIKWQDPNDAAQAMPNQTMAKIYSAPITVTEGMIMFNGVLGAGGVVTMTAAFAEMPVPEPATMILIVIGLFGVASQARRARQ
jgi:hypothetical protein